MNLWTRYALCLIVVLLGVRWTSSIAAAQPVLFSNLFDTNAQGWTAIDVPVGELCSTPGSGAVQPSGTWVATGGHPGGCFYYREPSNTGIDPLLRVGTGLAGDRSLAYGGFLRFDRRFVQNQWFNFAITDDLYMQGTVNGQLVTLICDTKSVPYYNWQANRVPLVPGGWRVGACNGPLATEAEITAVLAHLTEIKIKAEYRSGVEDHYTDNFMIIGPDGLAESTFETDAPGWTVVGDFASYGWIATEGIENVRCFKVVDAAAGRGMSFVAPPSFLGDKSSALGKSLELDLKSSVALGDVQPDGGSGGFVTLSSATKSLFFTNTNLPIVGNYWRHHAIPLAPSPQWTRSGDNAVATQADFAEVLASLNGVFVRAEFRTGSESNYLDNVVLGACSPSGTVSASAAAVCPGQSVSFTTVVAGTAPFSYRWTRNGQEIDPLANPSATSPTLVVQANAPADAGIFACIITNACGSVTSNPVTLKVCLADFNCDGSVDFFDYDEFVSCFEGGACPPGQTADFNHDGSADFFDYDDFITTFETPC